LAGHQFEIHAGSAYAEFGLADGLRRAGGSVSLPAAGLSLGQQLRFYGGTAAAPPNAGEPKKDAQIWRSTGSAAGPRSVGKYEALARRICGSARPLTLAFGEIDQIVGGLPSSALKHRAWWSNDRTHTQATAWLGCNRMVIAVDLNRGAVTFG
jgi:hypothetical protein